MHCPRCLLEGKKAEIVENKLMKRCIRCSFDFMESAIQNDSPTSKPIRGLNSILGAVR